MSEISPISQPNPALARIAARRAAQAQQPPAQTQRAADSVELSNTARLLSQLKSVPDVRQNLVDRVRAEIDAGTYETEDKLDATIDGILNEIGD